MRKLWIVVGALLVLFAATVITAALSLNRLIAGNHDRIIAQAQAALGRHVAVARISVSLWGGLAVRLEDVRIADDPSFGSEDFVRIGALSARAKLWPLLHQHFEVSRIVATQPHVNLIRNATGVWNCATLRPPVTRETTSAVAAGIIRVANAPAAVAPEPAALPFVVHDATLSDGAFVIVDRTQNPARTIQVSHLDAALTYTSRATPIAVRIAAAIAADSPNVDVHGSIGPWDDGTNLPLQLDGTLGPFAAYTARIDALHLVATLAPAQVHVTELSGRLLGGAITLSGEYPLQAGAMAALRGTVRDLDLAEAINASNGDPSRLGGSAHLIVDVRGTGTTREAIAASLTGRIVADIHEGVIKNLNIATEVLGKAGHLPVVGTVLSEKIKPKYARLFDDPDTHFETLHAVFTIGEQRAQTDDLAIVTTEYGVLGRGWIGFNRQLDMAGKLRMSKRFSNDVVADVHVAKYLLDDDGQLALPFHVRGTLDDARPVLNNEDIMALVQRGAVRGGAKDLLDKFFGTQPQATPGERKNPIEEGLRHLFGR